MSSWQRQLEAEHAQDLVRLDEAVAWTQRALRQADGDARLVAAGVQVMHLRGQSEQELVTLCANALVALAQQRAEVQLRVHDAPAALPPADLLWRAIERGERL